MPVLNDFGEAAYQRVRQQAEQLAARIGIQKEVIFGFFNDTAHFPQTIAELEAWGNKVDPKYGVSRRDPATGAWRPIMPTSRNPDPRLTEQDRGGFNHAITNAEDSDIQRFQQVDPSGNVFGGSFDPAYNAAHPGGSPGITAPAAGRSAQGTATPQTTVPGAAGQQLASLGFTPPPGTEGAYNTANPPGQLYGQATGATPTSSGSSTPASASGGGGGSSSGTYVNMDQINAWALLAYNNAKLALDRDTETHRDENEKARIALEAARDAWKKAYDSATLTGRMPDGTPTLDATKTTADITGYQPNPAAGKGQAVMDAMAALRTNPQYQALDGAGRRQMEAATVSQITGVDTVSAAQAIDRLRQLSATTGQMSSAALVEQVIGQTPAGQRPSLDREKEQNSNTIAALTLLSNLRGPENAFAYADTLNSLPPQVRANIQAAMGRLPFTAQNPAQRGVLGDVGALGGQQPGAGVMESIPGQQVQQTNLPVVTGPRTAQSYLPAPAVVPGTPEYQAAQMRAAQPMGQQPMRPDPMNAPVGPLPPGVTGQPALAGGGQNGTAPAATEMMRYAPGSPQEAAAKAALAAYQGATPGATTQPLPGGGTLPAYGPRTQPIRPATAAGMTLPGQLSPTDWNNTSEYGRQLLLAGYEHAGESKANVADEFARSLPRATGPRSGRYRAA